MAADDEEEEEGDDSQIIDLDGINGKKLAVSILFRTHNFLPSNPRLLLLRCRAGSAGCTRAGTASIS